MTRGLGSEVRLVTAHLNKVAGPLINLANWSLYERVAIEIGLTHFAIDTVTVDDGLDSVAKPRWRCRRNVNLIDQTTQVTLDELSTR